MKKADKSAASIALILGEDEAANKKTSTINSAGQKARSYEDNIAEQDNYEPFIEKTICVCR